MSCASESCASSMTPPFFCQKNFNFFSKKIGSFLLELVYLMTETKYGVHGFVNFTRPM